MLYSRGGLIYQVEKYTAKRNVFDKYDTSVMCLEIQLQPSVP